MKKALENTCLTGCLVYVVALVVIVALSTTGLGGLGARFGLGTHSNSSPTPGSQGGGNPAPIVETATPGSQNEKPTQPPSPPASTPTQGASQAGKTALPTILVQGEGISGQATTPFYVVQPGDTLWGLANRFGTTVDTLRALNKLGDQFIRPGQLLYLPQTQPQQSGR